MATDNRTDPPSGANGDATARIVRALLDPARYPHPAGPVQLIETHISYVLLTGRYAYKLKKPIRLPFLDFSTLERRRRFCETELELNRRFAPELYLGVVPIGGTPDAPEIGAAPAIEYAVKLVQFDPSATADRLLEEGTLDRATVERFAEAVAGFTARRPPPRAGTPDAARRRTWPGSRRPSPQPISRSRPRTSSPSRGPPRRSWTRRSRRGAARARCARSTATCTSRTSCFTKVGCAHSTRSSSTRRCGRWT